MFFFFIFSKSPAAISKLRLHRRKRFGKLIKQIVSPRRHAESDAVLAFHAKTREIVIIRERFHDDDGERERIARGKHRARKIRKHISEAQ